MVQSGMPSLSATPISIGVLLNSVIVTSICRGSVNAYQSWSRTPSIAATPPHIVTPSGSVVNCGEDAAQSSGHSLMARSAQS